MLQPYVFPHTFSIIVLHTTLFHFTYQCTFKFKFSPMRQPHVFLHVLVILVPHATILYLTNQCFFLIELFCMLRPYVFLQLLCKFVLFSTVFYLTRQKAIFNFTRFSCYFNLSFNGVMTAFQTLFILTSLWPSFS